MLLTTSLRPLLGAAALLSLTLPTGASQPEFRSVHPPAPGAGASGIAAPGTPHRGRFPGVVVVRSDRDMRAAHRGASRAIEVPRNVRPSEPRGVPGLEERLARNAALADWRHRRAPWRTDTSAYIEQVYQFDEKFDGWSYGVYWNTVTRRWERGYHTTEFGLDPDYYR